MSYVILSKTVVARDASKFVKAVFINRRATEPKGPATWVNVSGNNISKYKFRAFFIHIFKSDYFCNTFYFDILDTFQG